MGLNYKPGIIGNWTGKNLPAIGQMPLDHGRYMFNPNTCIGPDDTFHIYGPDPCIGCGPAPPPAPTQVPPTAVVGGIIIGYMGIGPPGQIINIGNYRISIDLKTGIVTAPYGYGPPAIYLPPDFSLQITTTVSASPPSWSEDLPVVVGSSVNDPVTGQYDPVATQQAYTDAKNTAVTTAFSVFGMTPS